MAIWAWLCSVACLFYTSRKMGSFPLIAVRQRSLFDCGEACLKGLFGYYGKYLINANPKRWRRYTLHDLCILSNQQGMVAKVYKVDHLESIWLPCLVPLRLMGIGHYVLVLSISSQGVEIMDPSMGKIYWISKRRFYALWVGMFLGLQTD